MDKIIEYLKANEQEIQKIVLSDTKTETKKIIIHKTIMKNKQMWQIEKYIGAQVFHSNVDFESVLALPFCGYKQITVEQSTKIGIFSASKTDYRLKEKQINRPVKNQQITHNKQKQYFINEGDDVPALVDLGIFTKEHKIVASMYDKFKQINKFIEIIDNELKNYNSTEITILDFGCGKSYLTFLVYYYFAKLRNIKAKIIGYDLKADVVEHCNQIAKKYGYDGLEFVVSDVKKDKLYNNKIDMVISLHACDTATDYALNFAINNNVKYIFSVPCCQHEINLSISKAGDFDIMLKDGLFKERFSALLTDAVRTGILRAVGYSVDVIEFVDFAHSPKNIMLRATKNSTKKSYQSLLDLQNKYKFNQTLLSLQCEQK